MSLEKSETRSETFGGCEILLIPPPPFLQIPKTNQKNQTMTTTKEKKGRYY
jgi:hypothetical protein